MNQAEIAAHRREGSLRAQRALKRLGADFESPIDIFGTIERERIWLMFQPLDHLYGAYRRHSTPGIVLHAGHPARTQRFTAAHELGHHLLGHDISVDSREEVENSNGGLPAEEIEAQAFAATFLMPVQLVNRSLSEVGLARTPHTIDSEHAYRLSLELGSSYTATVTQLRALGRITFANARELVRARPIDIKTELALGERPVNTRADIWPVSIGDSGRELWIGPDDEIHARLPESPTTGYRWRPTPTDAGVEIAGDEPVRAEESGRHLYGAPRERHVWWRAVEPAEVAIGAELRRSFEQSTPQENERFSMSLHVQPAPTGAADHGISRRQLRLL